VSLLRVYSKRVTLLVIIATAVIWIAQLFGKDIGTWAYIVIYPSAIAILVALMMRQSSKEFPLEAAATAERSFLIPTPLSRVSEMVPQAIRKCDWKIMQADETNGHFQAKVGISRKTWWQEMQINIAMKDGQTTSVSVRCVAPHILWDRGQNNKIDKFFRALGNVAKDTKEPYSIQTSL
jgi:hypothetical protein